MHVANKLQNVVQTLSLGRTGDVDAGVQSDPQTIDVVAKHHQGIGVFAQASELAFDADPNTLGLADLDQLLQMLNLFVERGSLSADGTVIVTTLVVFANQESLAKSS